MESSAETTIAPLLLNPSRWRSYITRSTNFNRETNIWSELGGSVGDLGTYIPIVLALSLVNHLDLGTTLIFTALYNILSGFLFGIPMPVQPMKSIAAVAISDGLVLSLSAILFIILVTGSGGDDDVNQNSTIPQSEEAYDSLSSSNRSRRRRGNDQRFRILKAIPAALIVFMLGLLLCFVRDPSIVKDLKFGPSKIGIVKITWEDWKIGFVRAAIPQIPLSILNSVIAVCKLSTDLFPDREVSAASVSVSVGLMNLVGCWFGAMPCCHGAGGLAGQYRFGGRSGASVVFLGVGKLVLGLVFGNSFVRILSEFPIGILGVMLLFSGIELAMASKDMNSKEESFVMLVCAAVSLTGSSAALGFGVGIVIFLLIKFRNMDFSSGWFSKCEASVDANTNYS